MSDRRTARPSGRKSEKPGDARTEFERDSDRILYSGALRRLAVITQVVSPAGGHGFHNRLTHALKVAQVGRRIAERLSTDENQDLIDKLGGLDPVVVEAAALAHDLGHPPFGHIAEEELRELVMNAGVEDGFEGNAQSFRIVTQLEIREPKPAGLDLTRATLNAILKYPWQYDREDQSPKFGAYQTETRQFKFARKYSDGKKLSLEAQIMDWADDITYAVHDSEDFYRIGKIPLNRLVSSGGEREKFFEGAFRKKEMSKPEQSKYRKKADDLFDRLPVAEVYSGSRTQRAALRGFASSMIHDAVCSTTLSEKGLKVPPEWRDTVTILKDLALYYVIEDPALATEQCGKRKIIRKLFDIFHKAARKPADWKMFPVGFREQLEDRKSRTPIARTVSDYVASLGEQRAVELHAQLSGLSLKPVATGLIL